MMTADHFMLIGITRPDFYDGEAQAIARVLAERGVSYVHIRKPGADDEDVMRLVLQIPQEFRSRLTMHYHFGIAVSLGLGGVHLSGSHPEPPVGWGGRISRSCHRILWPEGSHCEESLRQPEGELWAIGDGMRTDYDFLSPIYDSISKEGYRSAFSCEMLQEARRQGVLGERTVALGGVSWERLDELKEVGFGGAAMLGAMWR